MVTQQAKRKELTELSPEQKRTLNVLMDNWPTSKDIKNCTELPSVLTTGFVRASHSPVSAEELPKEEHWIWRQCNAKISVRLDDLTTVVMQKFNTRANKNATTSPTRPSYKLWNLRVIQKHVSFTFLYCERGEVSVSALPPPVTTTTNNDLTATLLGSWSDAFPDFLLNSQDMFCDLGGSIALDLSL